MVRRSFVLVALVAALLLVTPQMMGRALSAGGRGAAALAARSLARRYELGKMHQRSANAHYGRYMTARALDVLLGHCRRRSTQWCQTLWFSLVSIVPHLRADMQRAAALYEKSCRLGDVRGCASSAWMDAFRYVSYARRHKRAARRLRRACAANVLSACRHLGTLLAVRKVDVLGAVMAHTIKRCRDRRRGAASACKKLGPLFRRNKRLQLTGALDAFRRACRGGDAEGCARLAERMRIGRGRTGYEHKGAVHYASRACNAGSAAGCRILAVQTLRGLGTTKSARRARTLYARACKRNDLPACLALAKLLGTNKGGPKNLTRASALWRDTCALGLLQACARGCGLPARPRRRPVRRRR